MRKKVLAVILSIIFVFTQTTFTEAKARATSRVSSSKSRSISKSVGSSSSKSSKASSSSSKSSGYTGSSSSSSKSSAGSSSGSSRSVPGSYSSGSSSSKSSGYTGSSSSSKNSSSGSSSSKSSGYTGSSSSSKSSDSGSSSSKSSGNTGSSSSKSSDSGSSSSKSSGYTGSSSSSKSSDSGSTSSKSSGYTGGSSSKSSGSSSSKTSGTVNSKTDTLKTTYMQDTYKKQVSQNNYSAYTQKLNDEQKKVYESSFNSSYGSGSKMDFESAMNTRAQRVSDYSSRPIRININTNHFGSPFSYGYAFVGPWDLWFLMRASDTFWYHHWNDIYPYRDYFEAAQFAEMEKRVRALEAQNIPRDPSYLEPDADADLQLSSNYLESNVDKYYYTNHYAKPVKNPLATLVTIVIIAIVLMAIIKRLSRRRPRKPYDNSSIY